MPDVGCCADPELLLLGCRISRAVLDSLKDLTYADLWLQPGPNPEVLRCRIPLGDPIPWNSEQLLVVADLERAKLHFAILSTKTIVQKEICPTCGRTGKAYPMEEATWLAVLPLDRKRCSQVLARRPFRRNLKTQ